MDKCIICGSGNSIPFLSSRHYDKNFWGGIDPYLACVIKNNYSFGLNHFYRYGCETTANVSGDWEFYTEFQNQLEKLPLVIIASDPKLPKLSDNTIMLPHSGTYFGRDSWNKGIYTRHLVGMFGLTLAIALGFKEIYLLGYDCREINGKTHFYQNVVDLEKQYKKAEVTSDKLVFRGVGMVDLGRKNNYKTSTYNNASAINDVWYRPYEKEKGVKIFNVSTDSVINVFPKITYDAFYEQIGTQKINQKEAVEKIKSKIIKEMT